MIASAAAGGRRRGPGCNRVHGEAQELPGARRPSRSRRSRQRRCPEMYGSPMVYMATVLLAGVWGIFLVLAVVDGSLVRIGIAAAVLVVALAVQVYRRKRRMDEMDEMERRQ